MKLRNAVVALATAALLCACAGAPRVAYDVLQPNPLLQCRAERGMGGTGLSGEERGLGGTGVIASDERGLGGTGVSAGVLGTVTGFGSICVNGLRIAYDETTPVTVDGLPATLDALARGVTVAALVAEEGDHLEASQIAVLHALVGPVTSVGPDSFSVMGVPVETEFAAGERPSSFAVNDIAAVDGLQRADGAIDATRIVHAPAQTRALVRGSVEEAEETMLRVGAVRIAARVPDVKALLGRWISLRGAWKDGAFVPESMNIDLELQVPPEARLSFEGYLLRQPGGGFGIRGVPVRENLERALSRDVIERMAEGQRVQVIGSAEADGGLRPQTIIVPDWRNPLQVADVAPDADDAAEASDTDAAAARERAATAESDVTTREALQRQRAATFGTGTAARATLQRQRGVYGTATVRPTGTRGISPSGIGDFRAPQMPTPVIRPTVPTRPLGGRGG